MSGDPLEITPDGKVLREAKKRFQRCQAWESVARTRFVEDLKFYAGDSDNKYQWTDTLYRARDDSGKPALTINKTRQHCLQIINDARQNKAGIEVRPVGDGASKEAADIFEGVIRHIEYISNAQAAYDTATWNQVVGGIGWLRIVTDYSADNSFDQEIFIRRVPDALSVYLDPDIQQYDGSDARYGFVFRNMPRDEFDAAYPKLKDEVGDSLLDEFDTADDPWMTEETVRVAEYYRIVEDKDHLVALVDGTTGKESDLKAVDLRAMAVSMGLDDDPSAAIAKGPDGKPLRREIKTARVEWFLIAGNKIADRSVWPGVYVPLIRVVGEETVIDGQMDRRGHVRALKDPQRMYNYWSSSATEQIALQTKTPWLASQEAIGPYEQFYKVSNTENFAYLPWVERDETGNPNTKPERIMPPVVADAYIKGMQWTAGEMMMVSGQYQAVMGAPSNETSGKAINARQRQGDNATYHFIDHLAQAIRLLGKQLIDLIPKVYDTERVTRIIAEDGEETEVHIDPNAPVAHQEQQVAPQPGTNGQPSAEPDVKVIFNPNVGRYEVISDVGPAYATRRQEAFNAFVQIMQTNPELVHVVGDLMFKAADFPMSDDIAERMKNMLPPQALGGVSPAMQELMTKMQEMQKTTGQTIGQLVQQLAEAQLAVKKAQTDRATDQLRSVAADIQDSRKGEDEAEEAAARADQKEIDWYKAETQRLAAAGGIDPEALKPVIREMVSQLLGEHIGPIMDAHAAADRKRNPPEEPEGIGVGDSPPPKSDDGGAAASV